jgi:hypothetical protein
VWQEILSFLVPSTVGVLAAFVNHRVEMALERKRGCDRRQAAISEAR